MAEDAGRIKIDIDVESAKAKNNVDDVKKSIAGLKKSTEKSSSKSIFDNIQSSVSKAKNGISKLTSGVKAFNSGMSSAVNNSKKLANTISNTYTELLSKIKLATSAIKSFISLYNSFSSAYETQSSAETRLAVALRNSSDATQDQIDSIKELTSEYQQLGVIGDEVQLTGLQKLSTYVSSAESVKKLLPVLNDMTAQQYGFAASSENALSIATVLGKVLNGNVSSLKKYGYSFDESQEQLLKYGTEEQKVATLAEVVEASVGGMNNALANTPTGQITQLKNNFGDLKESLGELLTYVILPVAKYINVIIQRAIVGVKTLTEFIKSTFGIKTVARDINSINSSANNIDNKNIDNTSDSLNDLGKSADNTKKKVKSLLAPFDELNILADNSEDNIGNLSDNIGDIGTDIDFGYGVSETLEVPDLTEFKNKIADELKNIDLEIVGVNLANKLNGIINNFDPTASAKSLAQKLNKVVSFINGFLRTVKFENLGKKVGQWINTFTSNFDSKALGNIISNGINGAIHFANGALTETNFVALGNSIGNFLMGIFGNIDYEGLGDALINTLSAAVNVASGIISKIDFKAIGKGLAKATNRITRRNEVFRNLGKTISNAIIGVFDLAIAYLDETDFEQLGKSVGEFLASINWGTILTKAGEAIWKGLWSALKATSGVFKSNPVAGTLLLGLEGILAIKGIGKLGGTLKRIGEGLGLISKNVKTDGGASSSGISGLATSLGKLVAAHPAIAIITAAAAALATIQLGVANYKKNLNEWKKTLGDIKAINKEQETFINNIKTSNENVKNIGNSIQESGTAAETEAKKFKTLFDKLGDCVDEYGNVKNGSENYADYIINELNSAYGTNLENIDGQIKGYRNLCDNIDKYIAKMKAQAIVSANEGNYADAISEYSQANKDIVKAQSEYERNIKDLEGLANSVQNAYFDIFNEVIDFGDLNTDEALSKVQKALEEIGYALTDDPLTNKKLLGKSNKLDKFTQNEETRAAVLKLVQSEFSKITPIAKKYGFTLQNTLDKNYGQSVTELAYALHNNANEFLNTKNTAKESLEVTKQQIDGYETLTKTLNNSSASIEDITAAIDTYTNGIVVSKGSNNLDIIKKKYEEWQEAHNKTVEMYKRGELTEEAVKESEKVGQAWDRQLALAKANLAEGAKTWSVDATKALLNSKDFASEGEYLAWYSKLFGVEHIPDAIKSLTKVTGISPDSIIKQYLQTYPEGTSENNVKQIVSKLYPDATKEEIASKVKTYMNYGRAQALKRYFDEHPNMSESDKKAFLKSIMPNGTSDDTVNKLYKVITDTVDSAVFKAEKHFDGGMFSTKGALGDVLSPTAKNAMKNVKSGNRFVNIGNSMAAGVEEGLKGGIPNIQKASSNIIDESDKAMRKEGDIHSPSKLTKLTGIALSEGVAVGIREGLNKILNAVKYVCNKTVDAYKITGMNANILKTYAYSYVSNFFNGLVLKGSEIVNIKNITDKVVSAFKITLWNSGMLTKYGNTYVNDYIKGVVLSDTNKKKVSDIQTIIITLLKPSTNTLNSAKTYGSSILQNMINGLTLSNNNKTSISNVGVTIYNSMITSMNGLTGKLSTSSANFISYLTNPITNGLKLLLDSMDLFYTKFRNKWQGVANLFNNKFIAGSMGVTKVPNLNENYYPFGNNIVKLAQGAVIKPNNEFMAILGDQKRGLNIETPLATMKQAFIEALNEGNYAGGNITIPVYIGQEKLDTLIINSNNRRNMRNNGRG